MWHHKSLRKSYQLKKLDASHTLYSLDADAQVSHDVALLTNDGHAVNKRDWVEQVRQVHKTPAMFQMV